MSDTPSTPAAANASSPTPSPVVIFVPRLNSLAVFSAIGSPTRLPIVKLLADGKALSIGAIASAIEGGHDAVSKQLLVLLKSGLVEVVPATDRRYTIYQIPAELRPSPGILELGFCRIDLNRV